MICAKIDAMAESGMGPAFAEIMLLMTSASRAGWYTGVFVRLFAFPILVTTAARSLRD